MATFLDDYEELVRLFHPRKDAWTEHFWPLNGEILPTTNVGQATVKLPQLNQPDLLILRRLLSEAERWP